MVQITVAWILSAFHLKPVSSISLSQVGLGEVGLRAWLLVAFHLIVPRRVLIPRAHIYSKYIPVVR